jgi:glyoxylase-like metal-dependent hydrolase (beta-lactamase superfamily II)
MAAKQSVPAPVITELPEIGITVISKWLYNCYVIHDGGNGQPFVVDLGLPSQIPFVAKVLSDRGSDLSELGAAIATHGHADHVGGLPTLRDQQGTPVYLPIAIAEMRAGTRALRPPGIREVSQILPVMASQPRDLTASKEVSGTAASIGWNAKEVRLPFEPDSWLSDGDHLPGLPDWRVLNAPGHSDDSTCLFHAPTRTLLAGDAVLSANGRAWFNPEFVDPELSAISESRLRALDVEYLLPGHGLVVTGPRVMTEARSHTDQPSIGAKATALWQVLRNHAGRQTH